MIGWIKGPKIAVCLISIFLRLVYLSDVVALRFYFKGEAVGLFKIARLPRSIAAYA